MKNKLNQVLLKFVIMFGLCLTSLQIYGYDDLAVSNHINESYKTDSPQQQIEGTVYDDKGNPLIGVTIIIKGTQKGVSTDFDGKFKINASQGDTLVFSYLGFASKELLLGTDTNYTITMTPSVEQLEGVEIVSTGYQKISKERATGSFAVIDNKVLDRKIEQNIISKIAGEAPGVQFDPFIQEKNSIGLVIRGRSSINATTEPLVVVDGFAIPGGFSTINPNDVETISILKDAAASSIWGIRAANGVIVITTKSGSRNKKLDVTASINTAVTLKQDIFDSPFADPSTQVDYQIELFKFEQFSQQRDLFSGSLNEFSLFQTNSVRETLLRLNRGDIDIATADARINALRNNDGREEFSRLFLRQQLWNQYNLGISSGGDKYNFKWVAQNVVIDDNSIVSNLIYDLKDEKYAEGVLEVQNKSLNFLVNDYPGIPFPYDTFTTYMGVPEFDGMEFPMLANNGLSKNPKSNDYMTFHEASHTYLPHFVGVNEIKYSWMEEGWATFFTIKFIQKLYKDTADENRQLTRTMGSYLINAGKQWESPLIAPTNHLTIRKGHFQLSYRKPAFMLLALESLLGESVFKSCLKTYINRWKGKHPTPYDFMFTFNDVSQRNLNWFWKKWVFEYGYPDLELKRVDKSGLTIQNIGGLPVPVTLKLVYANGETLDIEKTPEIWQSNLNLALVDVKTEELISIELLSDSFPDTDTKNNVLIVKK